MRSDLRLHDGLRGRPPSSCRVLHLADRHGMEARSPGIGRRGYSCRQYQVIMFEDPHHRRWGAVAACQEHHGCGVGAAYRFNNGTKICTPAELNLINPPLFVLGSTIWKVST
jgi:hypothetical protein